MSKSREYPVKETYDFFIQETENMKNKLTRLVNEGKVDPIEARRRYDMYKSMLIYLQVCVNMAESEDYLQDNSFSYRYIYARNEESSKGSTQLKRAAKILEEG